MKCDDVGTGFGELRDNGIHRFHHEMNVYWSACVGPDGLTDHGSDCQVGDIVIVHDVEVDPVGARVDDIADFLSQAGEIGGEQAGRNTDVC